MSELSYDTKKACNVYLDEPSPETLSDLIEKIGLLAEINIRYDTVMKCMIVRKEGSVLWDELGGESEQAKHVIKHVKEGVVNTLNAFISKYTSTSKKNKGKEEDEEEEEEVGRPEDFEMLPTRKSKFLGKVTKMRRSLG